MMLEIKGEAEKQWGVINGVWDRVVISRLCNS